MSVKSTDILISLIKLPAILAGLWKRSLTNNHVLNKVYVGYSWFARIAYSIYYIMIVAELIRLIIQRYSAQIVISSFSVVVNSTKIALKIAVYLKNNIFELYDDVIERERDIWKRNDPAIIDIYMRKFRRGKLFSILLTGATLTVEISLNLARFLGHAQLINYNKANNASLESHFHFQFWFPGNKLDHELWGLFINLLATYTTTIGNITTHIALYVLLVYSATHLSILQHRLKHYIPEDLQENQTKKTIMLLKGLIIEHQYLISFTKKINIRCQNITLMEYFLSSFDAASVTLNIIKMNNIELVWFLAFFILLVVQIFCLAWCCNEVNLQSLAVADAAFESRWRLLNKDGKQLTQLMIQQAQQRPLMMTIGRFGPMTLSSFLTIWKIAYSYLSIMRK